MQNETRIYGYLNTPRIRETTLLYQRKEASLSGLFSLYKEWGVEYLQKPTAGGSWNKRLPSSVETKKPPRYLVAIEICTFAGGPSDYSYGDQNYFDPISTRIGQSYE